jgi:hypothetical protein
MITPEPETYYSLPKSTYSAILAMLMDAERPEVEYQANAELAMCQEALALSKLRVRSAMQLLRAVCESTQSVTFDLEKP